MTGLVSQLRTKARQQARALALSVIATVFLLVGLGFLSVALWMIVATEYGTLIAFEVMGALYVILGLICLLLRPYTSDSDHDETETQPKTARTAPAQDPWTRLAMGFAAGMQAGRATRDHRQ